MGYVNTDLNGAAPAETGPTGIRRVSFHTLGCKLNRSETDALAAQFAARGYQIVPFRQPADLAVINTCTVTGEADAKSRQAIRQAADRSRATRVAAIGCYTQMHPEEAAGLEGIDLLLGTRNKFELIDLLPELESRPVEGPLVRITPTGEDRVFDEAPSISATDRTRAALKVQDGCDYGCSYCIIPAARGTSRSRPLADCLSEARELVQRGYHELVITGVNLGAWTAGGLVFDDLLEAVSDVPGLRRIRISSIEPNLITGRTLQLIADRENICHHLHLPLQHASDRILGAMRRRYSFADYRRKVDRAVELLPDVAIGADVMVGFPGEKEQDFDILARALADLPNAYYHIFRYSERAGTLATALAGSVDPRVRRERAQVLREIALQKQQAFARRFVRQTRTVHFESRTNEGQWSGLTDNYLRVLVSSTDDIAAQLRPVTLLRESGGSLYGTLLHGALAA